MNELKAIVEKQEHVINGLEQDRQDLKDQLEERVAHYEAELQQSSQREKKILEVSKTQLEDQLFKTSADNISYHEGSVKIIELQFQREMKELKTEMFNEKSRFVAF